MVALQSQTFKIPLKNHIHLGIIMSEPETPYEKHPPGEHPGGPEEVTPTSPPQSFPQPGIPPPTSASNAQTQEDTQGTRAQIKCKICGKIFNSKIELDMHMESQHKVTKSTKRSNKSKRKNNK